MFLYIGRQNIIDLPLYPVIKSFIITSKGLDRVWQKKAFMFSGPPNRNNPMTELKLQQLVTFSE